MRLFGGFVMAVVLGASAARDAAAIPVLQLYIEGATYDAGTETWVSTSTNPVRLWTIGNVGNAGGGGPADILAVKLSIAYADTLNPTFTITGSSTGDLGGFTDTSTPADPTYLQTVTDGSSPLLIGGKSLQTHGIYGSSTNWQEFLLGDFDTEDSPIADFNGDDPIPAPGAVDAQINVYEITVSGVGVDDVFHFDLYNHVEGSNHAKLFAPFSHDGEGGGDDGGGGGGGGGGGQVPEPTSVLVWGLLGLVGVIVARRRLA
jgi:hypothetical protein